MIMRYISGSLSPMEKQIPHILVTKDAFHTIQNLYDLILNTQSNRIARSLAWSLSLCYSSIALNNTPSMAIAQSGEPRDYSRLSLEQSFLRATFSHLQKSIANGHPDADLILTNIIYKIPKMFPVVDWTFLITFCQTASAQLQFLTFCISQCGANSSKSMLKMTLVLFQQVFLTNPQLLINESIFGKLLKFGLETQLFSPTDLQKLLSLVLKQLDANQINV